jgi:hypothetical protein
MNGFSGINAYNKVGIESSVFGADPHAGISPLTLPRLKVAA